MKEKAFFFYLPYSWAARQVFSQIPVPLSQETGAGRTSPLAPLLPQDGLPWQGDGEQPPLSPTPAPTSVS